MKATVQEVMIAGLLHDIGKFAQRADMVKFRDNSMEGYLCKKSHKGYYTHQHVLYTQGFLEMYKDCLPEEVNASRIINLASYHHNPSESEHEIIARADRLSSGMDRRTDKELEYESSGKYYEKPMISIASTLHIEESHTTKERRNTTGFLAIQPLQGDAVLCSNETGITKEDYFLQWQMFEEDYQKLKGLSCSQFLIALDSMLERYTWCIPSSTIDDPDVSLYHHAKTTAAFASCIASYALEHGDLKKAVDAENVFLFLQGDLSGIQKYIFNLPTTKRNAKILRARSFQVWALCLIIAKFITAKFGVSEINIITFAGGRFLLLLPATKNAQGKIDTIQTELDQYMINEFSGRLACILSSTNIQKNTELMQKYGGELQSRIFAGNMLNKKKKLQKGLQEYGAVLDEQYLRLQRSGVCPICDFNPKEIDKEYCQSCDDLTAVGSRLVKAEKIQFSADKLVSFGKMIRIFRKSDSSAWGYTNRTYMPGYPMISLPYSAPFREDQDNELLTFEEIVESPDTNKKKKLAMFKADIDNLGLVFHSSLGNRWSLSRYSDISYQFHQFFSTFLNHLINTRKKYKNHIYVVYSGGDDLCVIGPWDIIMDFALEFRSNLDKFTNNNAMITLSGGIALASSSLPIRTLAHMSEESLDASKHRTDRGMLVKNGITIFGVTLSWEDYARCIEEGKHMYDLMTEGRKISSGTIYRIIDFSHRAERASKGNLRDLLWVSNYRYQIHRSIESKYSDVRDWFIKLGSSPEHMIRSRVSASYALYLVRD